MDYTLLPQTGWRELAGLGVPGVVRASFALYNTMAEADALINALKRIAMML